VIYICLTRYTLEVCFHALCLLDAWTVAEAAAAAAKAAAAAAKAAAPLVHLYTVPLLYVYMGPFCIVERLVRFVGF